MVCAWFLSKPLPFQHQLACLHCKQGESMRETAEDILQFIPSGHYEDKFTFYLWILFFPDAHTAVPPV